MQPCAHVALAAGAMAMPLLGMLAAPCLQLAAIMPKAPLASNSGVVGPCTMLLFLGVVISSPCAIWSSCRYLGFGFAFGGSKACWVLLASGSELPSPLGLGRLLFPSSVWVQSQDDPSEVDGTGTGAIASWHLVDGLRDLPRRTLFCDSWHDSMAAACIVVDHPWQFNRLVLLFHGASCMPRCTLQAPGPGEWTRLPITSRRDVVGSRVHSRCCL